MSPLLAQIISLSLNSTDCDILKLSEKPGIAKRILITTTTVSKCFFYTSYNPLEII